MGRGDPDRLPRHAVDGQEPGRFAFGLCYWDLDRGGAARAPQPYANPAFCLPGDAACQFTRQPLWVPNFVGYLSLAFWTATAFSLTDVSAVKRWAKLLMMIEAVVSLGISALVIARAINILN